MLRLMILLGALSGTLWMSAGCGGVKKPIEARNDPYLDKWYEIASEDLRRSTALQPPIFQRDEAGLLFVQVPIRATTDLQLYTEYKVWFLDDRGAVISETGWLTKTLPPNIHDYISFNSVSPRAADFRMALRYGRRN